MRCDDVNARARGLATHLLPRRQLLHLLALRDWRAAARQAADFGHPAAPAAAATPAEHERAVGRVVAQRLALLRRWLGPRAGALAVVFEDEDRRSIRILLRGAAEGAPPAARLRSLTATPSLPEPGLRRLAEAGSPGDVIRGLARLGHPAGRALRDAGAPSGRGGSADPPGLFGFELALSRLFAVRAVDGVRRAGRWARRVAAALVDRENAWTLLAAPGWRGDVPPAAAFLPGGSELTEATFVRVANLDDVERIRAGLHSLFRRRPLAGLFASGPGGAAPGELEAKAHRAQADWYRDEARRDPLGVAVLLTVIERIRGEAHDLRLIVGALASGADSGLVEPLLVTVR